MLRDYFAKGFDASHPKICFPLSAFRALAVASRRSVSKAAEQHLRGIGIKVNYSDKTESESNLLKSYSIWCELFQRLELHGA